jgi:GNAT superfamily N-acetyltransferase
MDSGEMVATGFLDVIEMSDAKKQGWIKFLAVEPGERGHGFASKIKKRIEKTAIDRGCNTLNCTVLADNPAGLNVELKDGFIFTDLFPEKDGKMKFFGYKRLDGGEDADRRRGPVGEIEEVKMSNVEILKKMINQNAKDRWAVVDIKNLGDKTDSDPENWVLILEKIS